MRSWLQPNEIYQGDSKVMMTEIAPNSIALSFWSPPYHVGKEYECDMSFEEWMELLRVVIGHHARILKPGAFLVINIADILCFRDPSMPRLMAENISRKRSPITRAQAVAALLEHRNFIGIEIMPQYIEIMPQYIEMAQRACDIAMRQVAAELLPFEEECPLAPKQSHSNNRQYRLEIQEVPSAEKELSR